MSPSPPPPRVIASEGVCFLPQGQPAGIAVAVAYLAGPDAGFITDQIINVNGGSVYG